MWNYLHSSFRLLAIQVPVTQQPQNHKHSAMTVIIVITVDKWSVWGIVLVLVQMVYFNVTL